VEVGRAARRPSAAWGEAVGVGDRRRLLRVQAGSVPQAGPAGQGGAQRLHEVRRVHPRGVQAVADRAEEARGGGRGERVGAHPALRRGGSGQGGRRGRRRGAGPPGAGQVSGCPGRGEGRRGRVALWRGSAQRGGEGGPPPGRVRGGREASGAE